MSRNVVEIYITHRENEVYKNQRILASLEADGRVAVSFDAATSPITVVNKDIFESDILSIINAALLEVY